MPDGVVVLDEHDRIEWLNPMAVDHFQLDRKRDVGNMVANLVRQPGFHDHLLAQNYSQPLILRLSQPVEQVLAVQLVPFDSTRKLLISRDITQLDRVQTVHRDFVANVSHELRTPLTVIGGFLETLADMDAPEPDVTRQFLPMMMEQAKRMQSLVEDLLTLSRLENGSKTASQENVDMAALLNTLRVEAEGLSQGRHQIILGDCDAANLWGNANELHSAFGNLVSNAVRYTPEGGRIRLDWRLDKGRGVFSVSDTGIGIAPQHIPRLTERFTASIAALARHRRHRPGPGHRQTRCSLATTPGWTCTANWSAAAPSRCGSTPTTWRRRRKHCTPIPWAAPRRPAARLRIFAYCLRLYPVLS